MANSTHSNGAPGVTVTPAGGGEHFQLLTDLVTIKAGGAQTSGKILLMEVVVPPGGGPPGLHRHDSAEVFYILEGEFEFTTLDTADVSLTSRRVTSRVGIGDVAAIGSRVWHNFKNVSAVPGRFLVVHSPTEMEGMARELGQKITDPLNPPPPGELTPEGMSHILQTVTKYVELLPPQQ